MFLLGWWGELFLCDSLVSLWCGEQYLELWSVTAGSCCHYRQPVISWLILKIVLSFVFNRITLIVSPGCLLRLNWDKYTVKQEGTGGNRKVQEGTRRHRGVQEAQSPQQTPRLALGEFLSETETKNIKISIASLLNFRAWQGSDQTGISSWSWSLPSRLIGGEDWCKISAGIWSDPP